MSKFGSNPAAEPADVHFSRLAVFPGGLQFYVFLNLNEATPYNKRKQKKIDENRDLREQFSFLPLLRPFLIGDAKYSYSRNSYCLLTRNKKLVFSSFVSPTR